MLGKVLTTVNEWRTRRNYARLVKENPAIEEEMKSLRVKAEADAEKGSRVQAVIRSGGVVSALTAEAATILEGCANYMEVTAVGPYGTAVRITFQKADGMSPAMRADEAVAILKESEGLREKALIVAEAFGPEGDMFTQAQKLQALVDECKRWAPIHKKGLGDRAQKREMSRAVDDILAQLEAKS